MLYDLILLNDNIILEGADTTRPPREKKDLRQQLQSFFL